MLPDLKEQVWNANLGLVEHGLVTLTWGNVSGIDRAQGLVVIKPSGVPYERMKPDDMAVIDLQGRLVEGRLNPSSDTPSHLEIYKSFEKVGGITHSHSEYATMFAQAGLEIPCLGTTHADHFHGSVPTTRMISREEVENDYEKNTGKVILERFSKLDPMRIPGILVAGHGVFTWGPTPESALENGLVLEKVAKMAWGTLALKTPPPCFPGYLLQKHFTRKHGSAAYYGQKKKGT